MPSNEVLFVSLQNEALHALRYDSRSHVYECYGKAKMAFKLAAITREQFFQLLDLLVVHGLNDPQYCREHYGGALK